MLNRAIPALLLGASLAAPAQAPQAQPKPAGKVEVLWLGQAAIRLTKSGTVTPLGPGIRITQVHAEHSSELVWHNPATDKDETHVGGEPVGFILGLENGFRLYHMGDTGLFGDMKMIGERYHPDLLLIPIGGHFVMDPKHTAHPTRDLLKPKFALPIHYGTIPHLAGTPAEYQQALGDAKVKVFAIQPGEKITF